MDRAVKKIVCEMCDCTEFVKEDGMFVCQECGCKYTLAEAKKLMVDVEEVPVQDSEDDAEQEREPDSEDDFPPHTAQSPNRISACVTKVGHETYTASSVMSLSAFFGEPEPVFMEGPDQVGHIGAEIRVSNLAGKPIKYIVVYVTPYNAVGDAVSCSVQEYSTFGMRVTGPIEVGATWEGHCDGIWYNGTIVSAQIAYATVEYMDGTKERFEAEDLTKQGKTNDTLGHLTISFDSNGGSAGALWYSIDHGDKQTLMRGGTQEHYLKPGMHTFSIMNPFMKKDYSFKLETTKKLRIYGKSFGMDISEQ